MHAPSFFVAFNHNLIFITNLILSNLLFNFMKLTLIYFVCICKIAIKLWNNQENNKGRILNLKEKNKNGNKRVDGTT